MAIRKLSELREVVDGLLTALDARDTSGNPFAKAAVAEKLARAVVDVVRDQERRLIALEDRASAEGTDVGFRL